MMRYAHCLTGWMRYSILKQINFETVWIMKKFLKYMSPFAPDQSGACSVFYELGGLIVICDAGGCAGNICGFDEPRWFDKKSAIFSAGLRDMDAVMGRDDKLIEKLSYAYEQLGGNFALIVSTPVPAVIATDLKSLERMCTKKLGIPCIAIDSTGTNLYDKGEEKAWFRLFETFASETFEVEKGKTGIIGATPLETGFTDSKILKKYLSDCGLHNTVIYSMGTDLDEVKKASSCEKNIAVSVSGVKAAEYLKERFGTPYEIAYPFIPDKIMSTVPYEKDCRILIIQSQLRANELRKKIGRPNTDCATWFTFKNEYALENDAALKGEDDLTSLISDRNYDVIIADSDAEKLCRDAGFSGTFIDFPEFAVSGRISDLL